MTPPGHGLRTSAERGRRPRRLTEPSRATRAVPSATRFASELAAADVLSLDVFDTVLTRSCGPPQALFLMLGRRLARRGAIGCSAEMFARERTLTEQAVWHREGGLDSKVSLTDIYRELARRLHLTTASVADLVAAELGLEHELMRPNERGIHLARLAERTGTALVFTTDTYFPTSFVASELERAGAALAGARCFASSEYGASKASGELFRRVAEAHGTSLSKLVHVGDHPYSDGDVPIGLGVQAYWLAEGRLNRYEELLSERMWATGAMTAAMAGASRLARLSIAPGDDHHRAIAEVAAGVAAPALVGYVLWVLQRARELDLARLSFVARDGQVMADVARSLVARFELDIDIRYLYASRRSVNLAATFEASAEAMQWIVRDVPDLRPIDVCERCDIEWDEVEVCLGAHGIRADDAPGSTQALRTVDLLRSEPALRGLLLERAARRREVVTAYLDQEGLLDGARHGIVDFGGVGSQVKSLHDLVTGGGGRAPEIFLVGLDHIHAAGSDPSPSAWLDHTECYLYDHRRRLGIVRPRGFGTCFQMFCAADHGTVISYRRRGDRVEPVLAEEKDQEIADWGLAVFRETIDRFVQQLVIDPELVELGADLREPTLAVIDTFWSSPSVDEARAWGSFPFEGAQADRGERRPLASRYSVPFVISGTLRRSFPNLGWQHWFEGSARLSSPPLRWLLLSARRGYARLEGARSPRVRRASLALRRVLGRSAR